MEFETILSLGGTLIMLIALQAVLGFDNLLYIALESKKAPADQQVRVRKIGIGIAIILRLLLLFILINLIASFEEPFLNEKKFAALDIKIFS